MTYLTDPDGGDIPIFSHAWAAPGVVSEGGGDLESAHLASWRDLRFDDRHDLEWQGLLKNGSVSKPCTPGEHQNSW